MTSRPMKVARVSGRYDMHYVDAGQGEPVLLIHGLAGDHHAWDAQVEAWSSRYRVIAPDNRGTGLSTQVDEPITIADMAGDFLDLMTQLGIERFHLVGRSMGGCIGQLMSLAAPRRVASMVWMASTARFDRLGHRRLECHSEWLQRTGDWASWGRQAINDFVSDRFFVENPEAIARIESLIAGTQRLPACYIRQNAAVRAHDAVDRLRDIGCPVLILSGGLDPLAGPQATRWMVEATPNVRWVNFEQSSHFFFLEEPARFMQVTSDWLAEQAAASGAV